MDLISILATVILATTIGTLIVGVGAYAAFKLRDSRKPKAKKTGDTSATSASTEPIFLKRYVPEITEKPAAE
ncbi:MAG: hypothetical protein EAZ34_02990 [Polaromonas sp.]|nr:MAG: hypothetical protein EAZ34_02990 [Polaromonas sp.]